ncbi:hypothetical protein JXM67_01150 [candidate division WOR-3 bacterium]|nr:hypothetical protein [candidate division WOR-3 bacterium]
MNHRLLLELVTIPSPSGCEEEIKGFILNHIRSLGIEVTDHGLPGLSWEIGEGSRLAIFTTNMDQTSFIVERIDDEGYVYLAMPGIDPRLLPSQEITVWGKRKLEGVVGMIPPHYASAEDFNAPVPRKKLFIDLGLSPEDVKELVPVGASCTWCTEPTELLGTRVTGPGLDNRIGVFLALLLTKELSGKTLPGRIRFTATAQKQPSMLGAGFFSRDAYNRGESVSFAVIADTTSGPIKREYEYPLGKGPLLGVGPVFSRPHLAVIREIASRSSLPHALAPRIRSTGTEADVISLSGEGVPSILVSIPVRYMNSPVELADLTDVDVALELLAAAFEEEDLWSC